MKYSAKVLCKFDVLNIQSNKSNNLDCVTRVNTLPAIQLPDFVSKVCVLPALYDKLMNQLHKELHCLAGAVKSLSSGQVLSLLHILLS